MKRIVLSIVLLVLMLSFPLASSPVMAAASLTVTPSSASLTIPDDQWNGAYVQVLLKNNGNAGVSNLRYATSGQIASWITLPSWAGPVANFGPGWGWSSQVNINPPNGQAPGTYSGKITFYGTDTSRGNFLFPVTVSASVYFTVIVPARPAWSILSSPIINGRSTISTVNVNQQFDVSVEVINRGNVPVTSIKGVLSLPSGFVISQNPVSVGNLNSYGNRATIKWHARATKPTGTYLQFTVTVSSNMGTLTETRLIRAI